MILLNLYYKHTLSMLADPPTIQFMQRFFILYYKVRASKARIKKLKQAKIVQIDLNFIYLKVVAFEV